MLSLVAAIALVAFPPQAQPGWRGAQWGMTPDQVSAAVPDIRPVRRGISVSNARKQSVSRTEFNGIALEAEYFYGQDGLVFIRLDVPFRRCATLVDGLLAEHGQPVRVSDQIILKYITWNDPVAGNQLVLLHSAAEICELRIKPLAEPARGEGS